MKIETGIKRTFEGVEQSIFVEAYLARYPYERIVRKVIAEPTTKGKNTDAYRSTRRELGDDWMSDLTDCWFEPNSGLKLTDQERISKMLDDLA